VTIEFFELLDNVFINWVNHIKDFITFFLEDFNEWRVLDLRFGFTSNEKDIFLSFFHSTDVVFERAHFITRGGSEISEETSNFGSVWTIFVDTKFKVFGELFVEFFVVFSILLDFSEKFHTFFGNVFLDNFEDFVLLEELSWDIKWEIFRIDNTLDERKIVWD